LQELFAGVEERGPTEAEAGMIFRIWWLKDGEDTRCIPGSPDHFVPYAEYGPEWTHTDDTLVIATVLVSY
jgi:hypothetical protein